MDILDKTLRVYADCSEGYYNIGNASGNYASILVEYISSTGTVKLQAYRHSSTDAAYAGRVTAFYFE